MFQIATWMESRSKALVHVDDEVLKLLFDYRQIDFGAPEAGGVFLGYRRGVHLHVTHATGPGKVDIRRNVFF